MAKLIFGAFLKLVSFHVYLHNTLVQYNEILPALRANTDLDHAVTATLLDVTTVSSSFLQNLIRLPSSLARWYYKTFDHASCGRLHNVI